MVWSVFDIYESDFGCEERMPGEPLMVMVELTCEDGRMCQLEVPDNYLLTQGIDVGDEWPFDLDEEQMEYLSKFHAELDRRSELETDEGTRPFKEGDCICRRCHCRHDSVLHEGSRCQRT